MTLDHLRAAYPALGFALYAYDPGGRVTLEIHDGKDVFTFSGATEAEVISVAFPESVVSQPLPNGESVSPSRPTGYHDADSAYKVGSGAETTGVFD
jgi:hypothetical protein